MIQILTSNKYKYCSMDDYLSSLDLEVKVADLNLLEIQSRDIYECVRYKAIEAAKKNGAPILIDDVGLYLQAYNDYPGAMVKSTLKGIGIDGLKALLKDVSNSAKLLCLIGIAIGDNVFIYQGDVDGYIDIDAQIDNDKMLLSSIFKCSDGSAIADLHRKKAFQALSQDLLYLRSQYSKFMNPTIPDNQNINDCVFCQEIKERAGSVFDEFVGEEIKDRVVYEDDDFIIIVPIGCFVEGGLLLLTREHYSSFSLLPIEKYEKLSQLLEKVKLKLEQTWGIKPIIFEHGPGNGLSKGKCCVDHAHLNIFPVSVNVHDKLLDRFPYKLTSLSELAQYKYLENGYLFVDSSQNGMYVYDAKNVPSQLIRRYITESLGMPERWHWLHYMGVDEMKNTLNKLKNF